MEQDGIPATAVTFRVESAYRGEVKPGSEIVVIQTGGTIDGVTLKVEEEVPLEESNAYLLFAAEGLDGTYVILGGSAGTYAASGGGSFTAVSSEVAPFEEITSDEVASLTQ